MILMLKILPDRVNSSIQCVHFVLKDHIKRIKELLNVMHVFKIILQLVKVQNQ